VASGEGLEGDQISRIMDIEVILDQASSFQTFISRLTKGCMAYGLRSPGYGCHRLVEKKKVIVLPTDEQLKAG
jgi:hypothetical protein